jgi:hypothetical protein
MANKFCDVVVCSALEKMLGHVVHGRRWDDRYVIYAHPRPFQVVGENVILLESHTEEVEQIYCFSCGFRLDQLGEQEIRTTLTPSAKRRAARILQSHAEDPPAEIVQGEDPPPEIPPTENL